MSDLRQWTSEPVDIGPFRFGARHEPHDPKAVSRLLARLEGIRERYHAARAAGLPELPWSKRSIAEKLATAESAEELADAKAAFQALRDNQRREASERLGG